ncbi:hypothetical protein [Sulfuricurvum sp.]|uniref:hypothetical protein n=1 Tax=Sulfuricurvum sp. TaxID=2025608 RepID=UPI00260B200E|nr:hypothetical protein [Sulfuricurvum sp.]MDD2781744.1 hypothetical protein [Sulfuricurvum sp.]
MIFFRSFFILSILFLFTHAQNITIRKSSDSSGSAQSFKPVDSTINIAIVSSPKVIGKYSQSLYNVALATLLSRRNEHFEIKRYDLADESTESLSRVLEEIRHDEMDAILAPLTSVGAKKMITLDTNLPIFIPTVHKRDLPDAPENFTFGGIDYVAQIEALLPYMGDSIAIFYDNSSVGTQLKASTEEVFLAHKSDKKRVASYPVDLKGDNIITHLSKPSKFNKASIILHIPVVKSALLSAHMTFTGVKEKNILSTQINLDPALLTLTQYNDRKNMILANSLIEFPSAIYESNAIMNNDITTDWIQYSTSVGIDYLVSTLTNTHREYTMRLINSQVIYPVELMRAKEFGFEPITSR